MDSRYLECFVQVVERGSIAEAARYLDMPPASLAQRLKALEASLGGPLVMRAGRTVRPTVAGDRILPYARRILAETRDMRSAASSTDLPQGPLRLGATPSSLAGILPRVLQDWAARHPQIEIYIEPGATATLYEHLMDGELDAAVLVHPRFALPKTCGWRSLRDEKLVLLAPRGQKVTDVLATAAQQPFIRYDRNAVAGRMADDYLKSHGIRPRVRFELDGIAPIVQMVASGLGVSVLPDSPPHGGGEPGLRRWPLPAPCPHRTVGVLWQRSTVRSRLAEAFVQLAARRYPMGK